MHRYYTTVPGEGVILVWQPWQEPVMWNNPERLEGETWTLQSYFRQPEAMIYVPYDVVRIVTQ